MEHVELVIKIPKIAVEYAKQYNKSCLSALDMNSVCINAIANGTPLPQGHRIGDLDALIHAMKERNEDNGGEPLNAVDRGYDLAYQHMVEEAKKCVIIEADKGEE